MLQLPHLTIVAHPKPSITRNTLLRALSSDDLALLQPRRRAWGCALISRVHYAQRRPLKSVGSATRAESG